MGIINATYTMPTEDRIPEKMKDLIRLMLNPMPSSRLSILDCERALTNWDNITTLKLPPNV